MPEIDIQLHERLIDTALEPIPESTLTALGDGHIRAALEEELRTCVSRMSDIAAAEASMKWVPIETARAEDFLYRLIVAGEDRALTSLRFKGGDPAQPFVQVHLSTQRDRPDAAMGRAIASAYSLFGPRMLRWFDCRPIDELSDDLRADLRIIAGTVETIIANRPASSDRLRLVRSTGLEWYERYVRGYEAYFQEYPELVGDLNYETRETLQRMLDAGTLFEAWAGDIWAGVIGTWREREYFIDGYVVVERMLVPELRGLSLGAALVWHLAVELDAPGDTIIFGTIAPANRRSRRSAESVGRVDVGGYVFAALGNSPTGNSPDG